MACHDHYNEWQTGDLITTIETFIYMSGVGFYSYFFNLYSALCFCKAELNIRIMFMRFVVYLVHYCCICHGKTVFEHTDDDVHDLLW